MRRREKARDERSGKRRRERKKEREKAKENMQANSRLKLSFIIFQLCDRVFKFIDSLIIALLMLIEHLLIGCIKHTQTELEERRETRRRERRAINVVDSIITGLPKHGCKTAGREKKRGEEEK